VKKWQLQGAKAQFSQVVDLAVSEGPQLITRYDRPIAVVVSSEDFEIDAANLSKLATEKVRRKIKRLLPHLAAAVEIGEPKEKKNER